MRAAIIGMGGQGRRVAQAIQSLPGLELVAVADLKPETLAALDLGPGVLRTAEPSECWTLARAELLCITTYGPSHAPLAVSAMEAGVRRVMVEKPMGCSVDECHRMREAAAKSGSRFSVNQSRRVDPFYRWLRASVRSGAWGELRSVFIQRPGIGLGCLGTHYFDLVRFLAHREILAVTAWVDEFIGPNPRGKEFADPGGLVVLDMGPRMRGVITQIEDGAGPMSVELDLTGARVRIDEHADGVELIVRDRSIVPGPGRPAAYVSGARPEASAKTDPAKMVRAVLEDLAGDGPLECDPGHGEASIHALVAAHLSSRRGHLPVALPLTTVEDRNTWLPVTRSARRSPPVRRARSCR